MSADNWAVCPRCQKQREEALRAKDVALTEAYGSVPVEEFDRLRAERDEFAKAEPGHSFREDYEIWGAEEGEFHVSYRGRCQAPDCGLGFEFTHDSEMDVDS